MSRDFKTLFIRLAALGAAACSSVYAVRSGPGEGDALAAARPIARSPFTVELVAEDGRVLDTYANGGRSYVLGAHGGRYSIRIKNPTARRVEAVISVDGLDVIDGEGADFTGKRGYVVPAYGELTVDGFRTSTTAVAAFRFSAVADSYADRKGKGRNVGVIGVAIFDEKEDPQMIMPQETVTDGRFDDDMGADEESGDTGGFRGTAADKPAAESAPSGTGSSVGGGGKAGNSRPAEPMPAAPPRTRTATRDESEKREGGETCCAPRRKDRPGLGTQFGEQRWSAVDFTRFVRANGKVPVAMAELRYNDAEGLRALGIRLQPTPDENELMRRETADPFPDSHGFASPPPQ
ncbi:MAG TPA: hypothetical protein VIG06_14610 [Kofleriaceae bacterium]|jgi:hypothetical protein